jgi:DNA-binding MarR family transcriptional regulator
MDRSKPTLHLLLHAAQLVEDRVRIGLEREGLHHGQARLLDALSKHGPQSISQLARTLHVAQPTVTIMVQRMESSALVTRATRTAHAPKSLPIQLTARGRKAAETVLVVWQAVELELRAAQSEVEHVALHNMLRQVRNALGGRDPEFAESTPPTKEWRSR